MQRALIAGLIIGVLAPVIGTFLVVRRYSLFVDTLSHVSLLGIAIGLVSGLNPYLTATGFAVVSSIAIEKIKDSSKLYQESILAMFLSGSLAISIIIISATEGFNVNLFSLLFGSITTVTNLDLVVISVLSSVVLAVVIKFYRQFFLLSLDQDLATASGVNAKLYNLILVVSAAITVSLSIRIVGVLLISALMVIPVITAMQFKTSFKNTMFIALAVSVLSVVVGLIASYYLGWASGGTIVVTTLICFVFSSLLQKFRTT